MINKEEVMNNEEEFQKFVEENQELRRELREAYRTMAAMIEAATGHQEIPVDPVAAIRGLRERVGS